MDQEIGTSTSCRLDRRRVCAVRSQHLFYHVFVALRLPLQEASHEHPKQISIGVIVMTSGSIPYTHSYLEILTSIRVIGFLTLCFVERVYIEAHRMRTLYFALKQFERSMLKRGSFGN